MMHTRFDELFPLFVRLAILCVAAALVAVAITGCGDGEGDDSPEESTPAGETTGGTAAPTAGPDAGEFEELAAAYTGGVDGRVVYSIDSQNFGVHPKGTWTTYRREGEIREDWAQNANGYDEVSAAIVANDGFFFCQQTPFTVTCTEQPSRTELEVVLLLFTTIKDYPAALLNGTAPYTTTDLPGETIAGEDAACFEVAVNGRIGGGPAGTETATLCYRDDGTLLRMARTVDFTDPAFENAEMTVVAQETGDAAETDFDLPESPTPPPG
jgi:hypothetical protein